MPDHGSSYWPLDEASGTVVNDALSTHDGVYFYQTETAYSFPYAPTTPAPITYQVEAPSLTGYGVGLTKVANGRPAWTSPYNWNAIRIPVDSGGGWGSMYGRQEFTISAKIRWYGPVYAGVFLYCYYASFGYSTGYSVGFTAPHDVQGYALEAPHYVTFTRWNGSGTGSSSTVIADVDIPSGLDYIIWDDWDGGTYAEPIREPVWMHLVVRYDGDYKSIWIDGEKIVEETAVDGINIGYGANWMFFNWQMKADWSDIALWHHALTDEEIGG